HPPLPFADRGPPLHLPSPGAAGDYGEEHRGGRRHPPRVGSTAWTPARVLALAEHAFPRRKRPGLLTVRAKKTSSVEGTCRLNLQRAKGFSKGPPLHPPSPGESAVCRWHECQSAVEGSRLHL
ncbi:unnamed protein product, partial [Urochloa humidicola]